MALSVSLTITMTDGEKPSFVVNGDWETHLADFTLSATRIDGTTVVVPGLNFAKTPAQTVPTL
jgi:hypothetical protein